MSKTGGDSFMSNSKNHYNIEYHELKNMELLYERLSLTLAFSKRYQMSTAVCYLRLHLPIEQLSLNKGYEKATTLVDIIVKRLNGSIRDIDTAIKINKTDFVLLLTNVTEDDCSMICERIIQSISDIYQVEFNYFPVSSNIGICMFPYGSEDPEELLTISKAKMYESQSIRDNHFVIFKGTLDDPSYRKVLIENDLPYALRKSQFHVEYQPQFSIKEGKIQGVEALIRWKHPSLGEISPLEFIPFAEEAGVLNDLFFWLFEEVCKNISSAKNMDIKYSINLSVNQLLLDNFFQNLLAIIHNYSVSPAKITLEITENIEIYTVKKINHILQLLRAGGFTIALDDFGNGYFSFSSFIHLPIDFIKLDRDFVTSLTKTPKHKHVISFIITMAHNLDLSVVVEGIEEHNQFSDWAQLNCDIVQGYFISKPISHIEFINSIRIIETRVHSY